MKKCVQCGVEFDDSSGLDICSDCAKEQEEGSALINRLIAKGHPYHCSFRQIWGDGLCECELYKKGHDPYDWMK